MTTEAIKLAREIQQMPGYDFNKVYCEVAAELRRLDANCRSLDALNKELVDALKELSSCWKSVCLSQGWDPEHRVEAVNAVAALAKAGEKS